LGIIINMKVPTRYLQFFYFSYFLALSAIVPYFVLIYKDRGFSGDQIGLLTFVPPFLALISASLWAIIADVTQKHKWMLAMSIISVLAFGVAKVVDWPFAVMLLLAGGFSLASAPITVLADAKIVEVLGNNAEQYGRGSEVFGMAFLFIGFAIAMTPTLFISLKMHHTPQPRDKNYWKNLKGFLKNPSWQLFLLIVILIGACRGLITNYVGIYMKDMGASTTLVGNAYSISALSEVVVFYFSVQLLKRFSATKLLVVSLLLFGIRLLLMGSVTGVSQLLFIQLLHSVTFAPSWLAGVDVAKKLAPKGLEATGQGLMTTAYMGIGYGFGSLYGGVMLDRMPMNQIFLYAGLFMFIIGVGVAFMIKRHDARNRWLIGIKSWE